MATSEQTSRRSPPIIVVGVVLLGMVVLIVALLARPHGASSAPHAGATPTTTPTPGIVLALCGKYVPLSAIPAYPYTGLRVVMASADEAWAVGHSDSFSHYSDMGFLLHWQNGLWRQAIIPDNVGDDRIRIVNAVGPRDVWFDVQEGQTASYLLRNLKGHWSKVPEPLGVRGIHAFAPDDIYGEDEDTNFWHYDGANWGIIAHHAPDNSINETITMLAPNEGWAINNDRNQVMHWDGTAWKASSGIIPTLLWSASFATPTDGWAGGNGKLYAQYHNGTWRTVTVGYDVYQAQASFAMLTPEEGWVGGAHLLARYHNGAWQQVAWPLGPYGVIYNFSFVTPTEGWAAAADTKPGDNQIHYPRLLHYLNGTWQPYSIEPTPICLGK